MENTEVELVAGIEQSPVSANEKNAISQGYQLLEFYHEVVERSKVELPDLSWSENASYTRLTYPIESPMLDAANACIFFDIFNDQVSVRLVIIDKDRSVYDGLAPKRNEIERKIGVPLVCDYDDDPPEACIIQATFRGYAPDPGVDALIAWSVLIVKSFVEICANLELNV